MPRPGLCFIPLLRSLLLLALSGPVLAAGESDWHVRTWQTDDGLSNNKVSSITQTDDGYLWLVLPHNLVRFDGIRFTKYPLSDNNSGDVSLLKIMSRRAGGLWIEPTTRGSVFALDRNFLRVPMTQNLSARPAAMAEAPDGSLWLGYPGQIYRVKGDVAQAFSADEGVPEDGVNDLVVDGTGNVWLAKGKKICVLDNGRFRQILSFGKNTVVHLAATRTNEVWAIAGTDLIKCRVDGAVENFGSLPAGPSRPATVRVMLEDHHGNVWIGTDGDGLFRFDKNGFEKIDSIFPYVLCLTEDNEGNIWVGTSGGGIARVSLTGIRLHGFEHGTSPIQSICEDEHGVLWAATLGRQLIFQSDGQWFPMTNSDLPKSVTCVAAGKDGGLWLGTSDNHVFFWRTNELKVWPTSGRMVVTVVPDSHGDVWVAESGTSIQRIHDGEMTSIKVPSVSRLTALIEDAHGTMWLGTDRGRLLRAEGDQFIDDSTNMPITGRPICSLYSTPDNSLWIGYGGGLVRRKDGIYERIEADRGLPDEYISQIVGDNEGWLWFATDHGVFKARPEELDALIRGRIDHLRPVIYGKNEGLISLEAVFSSANPFIMPKGVCARDGRVWLLMRTGLVVANPDVLQEPSPPPSVIVTRVAVDNQTVAGYGKLSPLIANLRTLPRPIQLAPNHRKLEFEFTAMDFSAPENARFRYRLDGLDDDWLDAETRSISYNRLPAGNYQFRVEASKDSAAWNEAILPVRVTVMPFFWQTWWFEAGVIIFFTAIVIVIVRYVSFRRLRLKLQKAERQAALEKERSRIARDIHDDVGSGMTQIALLSGLTARDRGEPTRVAEHAQQISIAARHVTDALDEIVWAVNPRNDTLPHLVNYLGEYTADFLRMADIRHQIDLPAHPPEKFVSTEARHNLFLVVKEALNNIARHSGANEASLHVTTDDHAMRIVIQDNGRGFQPPPDNGHADGLRNMPQRMHEIGGEFQIDTGAGGTRICLVFPFSEAKIK